MMPMTIHIIATADNLVTPTSLHLDLASCWLLQITRCNRCHRVEELQLTLPLTLALK